MEKLTPGTNVWWDDPEEGLSSGWYKVVADEGDIILIVHNDGTSEAQVFRNELKTERGI